MPFFICFFCCCLLLMTYYTYGHSCFYEISLNASYIPHQPTVSSFAALGIHSCHSLPEDEHNGSLDASPWAHRGECDSKNRPLIKTVKWSPFIASDETLSFFPNQFVILGHHVKDKQLQRPKRKWSTADVMEGPVRVAWQVFQFSRESVNPMISREQNNVY